MARRVVSLDESLEKFVDFGIDYVLNYFYKDDRRTEQPRVPDGHKFHKTILEDVTITITLMRWYFQKLFHFTFIQEEFMNDVKFYWDVWIRNRKILYVKVIDAFAIIVEAKLYSEINKAIPMSTDDCKTLMRRCLEDLRQAVDFELDWNNLYANAPQYPDSILGKHYNIAHVRNMAVYNEFEEEFFHAMQKSVVKFPIDEMKDDSYIKGSREHMKYIFIRLPTEMNECFITKRKIPSCSHIPLQEYSIQDGSIVSRNLPGVMITQKTDYTFLPQDRKYASLGGNPNCPSAIVDNEEARVPEEMTNWIKLFARSVLKEKDILLNHLFLISPRYNNSLETMLAKRYSRYIGNFFGDCGNINIHQSNVFTSAANSKPDGTTMINWIEAMRMVIKFIFIGN